MVINISNTKKKYYLQNERQLMGSFSNLGERKFEVYIECVGVEAEHFRSRNIQPRAFCYRLGVDENASGCESNDVSI